MAGGRAVLSVVRTRTGPAARAAANEQPPAVADPDPDHPGGTEFTRREAQLVAELERSAVRSTPREVPEADLVALLGRFGIAVLPSVRVTDADEAVVAAARLRPLGDGSVVLKATAWHLRSSPDQRDVWRNIATEDDLREAFVAMTTAYGGAGRAQLVVQPQASPGVPVAVDLRQDRAFGPVLSFGIGGVATELLGDRTHGIPPMTDREVDTMIRGIRAAPLLFGYRGGEPVDVLALRDLIHRVSALAEALPGVAELHLNPTLVSLQGCTVLRASATLTDLTERPDWYRRQLPTVGADL